MLEPSSSQASATAAACWLYKMNMLSGPAAALERVCGAESLARGQFIRATGREREPAGPQMQELQSR